MELILSEIQFDYDFFSTVMPNGYTLIINKIDEELTTSDGNVTANIKRLNIVITDTEDGNDILCSSVIGIGNEYLMIKSGYTEFLGKVLTEDNMKYCTLEIVEDA